MKRTAETMYATAMIDSRTSSIAPLSFAPLEHLQHSVRHDESAEDVGSSEHDGDEPENLEEQCVRRARNQHRAEHDDAVNRVGRRHERRVEDGRNARDDFEADEN